MRVMSKKTDKVQALYEEYVELRKTMSHDDAMAQFDYLHSITLARLKKRIVDNSVDNVEKRESAS